MLSHYQQLWWHPYYWSPWWRHQMEIFSSLLAICAGSSPVTGEFPAQRPVTRNFDVFFDPRLNKRLSKQPWGWCFETPSRSLWRHCNGMEPQVFFVAGSSDHNHHAVCMHSLFIHYCDSIGFRCFRKWPTLIRAHTNILLHSWINQLSILGVFISVCMKDKLTGGVIDMQQASFPCV